MDCLRLQLVAFEGVQNRPPEDVPLWHLNYFELKAVKTPQARKKRFSLPKESILRALRILELSPEITLWSMHRTDKHLTTQQLLLLCSNDWLFPLWSPRLFTASLAQNVTYISFYLFVSDPHVCGGSLTISCAWGSHTYVCNWIWLFSLVKVLHVNVISRPARRTWKGKRKFLPGPHTSTFINW